jgi:DNA-binding MarR family transcriptional regulator
MSYHDIALGRTRVRRPGDNRVDMTPTPSDDDYRRLLDLRTGLRRFLRWSERQAQAAGLTPTQHQLLLAVRGHPDPRGPTVGDVAGHLLLRHHSAVGLIDRAEAAGLVARTPDAVNPSAVRLRLTGEGSRRLEALSELHLEELAHLAPTMHALWQALERDGDGAPRPTRHPAAPPHRPQRPS